MVNHRILKEALLIRRVEETFLELYSKGRLNGTVHTCVGQEFSAVAFAGQLKKSDFIFSNHRCHGHYIAFTGDCRGLIAELLGKRTGVSGGIGSSQHLRNQNFFSNGVQGGIVPVAAGLALAGKLELKQRVGIVFIGDGTLGEGVLYETLNCVSKWEIPLLIVCENNKYAQSTPISASLAGDILARAKAFDIPTRCSNTWDVDELMQGASESIEWVRTKQKPLFHLVDTYRLNAHSKGDDDRDLGEVDEFRKRDFLENFSRNDSRAFERYLNEINSNIDMILADVERDGELSLEEYLDDNVPSSEKRWTEIPSIDRRQVELLNEFFQRKMEADPKTLFIGEDILSPYGGAFKVARGLSEKHPDRVISTPISEAAIVGISNGLALGGFKPYAEIMFGDFVTLAMDQIVNHASKFRHMYNKQVNCPIVIRTPMGGGRGYGPTHSQTLDRFLIGIDNIKTIALNSQVDPGDIYESIHSEMDPVIVIENKLDYGKRVGPPEIANYKVLKNDDPFPVVKASPVSSLPTITIVTYGGCADWVLKGVNEIFYETDELPEVIVLSKINPINIAEILESVCVTKRLIVVEEGSSVGGIGSEIVGEVLEKVDFRLITKRVGALPVPIPSVKSLENRVLPSLERVIASIAEMQILWMSFKKFLFLKTR